MIKRTFCHIPGIGPTKEQQLWRAGILSWEDLAAGLRSGATPAELLRQGRSRSAQQRLFHISEEALGPRAKEWLCAIERSLDALGRADYDFFLSRLPQAEHWRVLIDRLDDAIYLDIETTGLSKELHQVTVIGALRGCRFYQWTWPEKLDSLWELIADSKFLVTFNGRLFDIPFLQAHFAKCPDPKGHVDLRYLASKAKIPGGQKGVEKRYGYSREDDVQDVRGFEAVALWSKALYGDREAYGRLLTYNRADVVMLPRIAAKLCDQLANGVRGKMKASCVASTKKVRCFHRPADLRQVIEAWDARRSGLHLLQPVLRRRLGELPIVVGVDLRGNPKRPTGFAVCQGERSETSIVYDDQEIIDSILAAKPDLVSIDAPLSLPRGRQSVSDDSPCRESGGIVREAERVLWSRRIPVYPSLIRHMQGLTRRGIEIATRLCEQGIPVIESYPGAAQDVLGIARKGLDISLLELGLKQFGFEIPAKAGHDELDAITSALVGYFFLAGEYEAIGADDEGYMIIPLSTPTLKWHAQGEAGKMTKPLAICLAGLPGAGKTTLARKLASRFRSRTIRIGHELRLAARLDKTLSENLGKGDLGPEQLVERIVADGASRAGSGIVVIDGFPRHPAQVRLADELFADWVLITLDVSPATAMDRIKARLTCERCGHVSSIQARKDRICPECNMPGMCSREEDDDAILTKRMTEEEVRLQQLLSGVKDSRQATIDADVDVESTQQAATEIITARLDKRGPHN